MSHLQNMYAAFIFNAHVFFFFDSQVIFDHQQQTCRGFLDQLFMLGFGFLRQELALVDGKRGKKKKMGCLCRATKIKSRSDCKKSSPVIDRHSLFSFHLNGHNSDR